MTEPTRPPNRLLIPILGVCAFLVGWDSMVVAPIAPAIMFDLGVAGGVASFLVAAYALAYFVFSPVFGALSDRVGRKPVLMAGLIVFSLGTLLTAAMNGWWLALAMRAVAGLGGGMIMPSVFSLVAENTPAERRSKAVANVMAMLLASTIIGVPLGAWLAEMTSWRWVFVIIAAFGFAIVLLSAVLVPGGGSVTDAAAQRSATKAVTGMLSTAFRTPILLLTLAATFCWNSALEAVFSSIGAFYNGQLGFTEGEIGLVIFAAGIASVVGAALGGRLVNWMGLTPLMGVASLGAAVGVLVCVVSVPHPVPVIAANVLWSACVGMGQPALTTLASELRPELRGTALALNGSTQYAAMFVASLIGGSLATVTGSFVLSGVISAVFALVAGALIWVVVGKGRPEIPRG